jgi:hypothetical protein
MENLIMPLPWAVNHQAVSKVFGLTVSEISTANQWVAYVRGNGDDQRTGNANAIVTAINSTYGKGIDPSSVPELLEALKIAENYLMFSIQNGAIGEVHKDYLIVKAAIDKAIIKK